MVGSLCYRNLAFTLSNTDDIMTPRQLGQDEEPHLGMSPSFLAPKHFLQGKLCGESKQVELSLIDPTQHSLPREGRKKERRGEGREAPYRLRISPP